MAKQLDFQDPESPSLLRAVHATYPSVNQIHNSMHYLRAHLEIGSELETKPQLLLELELSHSQAPYSKLCRE